MIVYLPTDQIFPDRPWAGKKRAVVFVVIVLVLGAMGWSANDVEAVLLLLLLVVVGIGAAAQ